MNTVTLNVRRTLEFFDDPPKDARGHATAICAMCGEELGVGLMTHYFRGQGATVETCCKATQGTRRGKRLDCWMKVTNREGHRLFQVEIKNWSAHAIGGKRFADVGPVTLPEFMQQRWRTCWDDGVGIRDDRKALQKVLVPMEKPAEWASLDAEPLACIWDAIHPKGKLGEPFFPVQLREPTDWGCNQLWFFSMSAYLRNLRMSGIESIELDMPVSAKRRKWLDEMFPISKR